MALFKRNKTESVMPEEVQNFYAAERRQHKGKAWLLAIATLLITFLIASLLFFGGRWIFKAIFGNDDKTSTSQNESSDAQKSESSDESAPKVDQETNTQTDSNASGSGQSNATSGSGSAGSGAQSTVPATGPSELVDTGPGDENW